MAFAQSALEQDYHACVDGDGTAKDQCAGPFQHCFENNPLQAGVRDVRMGKAAIGFADAKTERGEEFLERRGGRGIDAEVLNWLPRSAASSAEAMASRSSFKPQALSAISTLPSCNDGEVSFPV